MGEPVQVTINLDEEATSLDITLKDYSWYLGSNTTTQAALLVLKECTITNCFVVYKQPMEDDFTLSMKIIPTGTNVNMYEHLKISKTLAGMYTICGPKILNSHDFIRLIDRHAQSFLPPLLPAVGTNVAQLKSSEKRPISIQLSGSSLTGTGTDGKKLLATSYTTSPMTGTLQPQWNYHQDKSSSHPQNLCHGCCYRKQEWNGSEYTPSYSWYNIRGNGPLRCIGVLAFWVTCGACFGIYRGVKYAAVVISHVCCNLYDNEE